MATITNFAGKQEVEPGAYSQIIGSGTPQAAVDTFGNVLLIDTGIGTGFTAGAGVNGQLKSGLSSLQDFFTPLDMKNYLKGGILYDLVDYLWAPSNNGNGPQKVSFLKAATTTGATYVMSLNSSANSITYQARNEGTFGNGVLNGSVLTNGYGVKIKAGILNPNKFIIEIYEGQFKGLDPNGNAYGLTISQLQGLGINTAVYTSIEFARFAELVTLLTNDRNFNKLFKVAASSGSDFAFDSSVLIALPGINVFTGGTCVYNAIDVDDALAAVVDVDNDMFLCLDYDLDQTPLVVNHLTVPVLSTGGPIGSGGGNAFSGGGTFFWVLTVLNANGETTISNELTATIAANGSINFTWPAVANETNGYRLYRGTVTATENKYQTIGHGILTFTDIGAVGTTGTPPVSNTASYTTVGSSTSGNNKGALSTANEKILNYVNTQSTFTEKALYIGGNSNDFDLGNSGFGTLQMAQSYNNPLTIICHSGIEMPLDVNDDSLFLSLPSLYMAAMVCGREAGLQPQTPGTYKDLRVSGVTDPLSKSDRVRALEGGVLHLKQVGTTWLINQSINTMQVNTDIVNTQGNSPEISVMRIKHQLNKELIQAATPLFTGGNLFTASDADVLAFTESFLQDRTVEPGKNDNLIIAYKNIVVGQFNGKKSITYCFKVNEPVNQTLFTGTMFDSRVTF